MKLIYFSILTILVFGFCGCGGGGGGNNSSSTDNQVPTGPQVIKVSGLNESGTINMPAGLYNLDISGSGQNINFPVALNFNTVEISSINSTVVINGSVDSLSVSGSDIIIFCYSKPRQLIISGVSVTVHLPSNATPLLNLTGVNRVVLYDLPAVP